MQNWTLVNDACVGGGRYCGPDPDGAGPITGRDVVLENLRQVCIFKSNSKKWWDYMSNFRSLCLDSNVNIINCSYRTMEKVGVKVSEIETCYNNSFVDKSE